MCANPSLPPAAATDHDDPGDRLGAALGRQVQVEQQIAVAVARVDDVAYNLDGGGRLVGCRSAA